MRHVISKPLKDYSALEYLVTPDDCCVHETLSGNKGFELTHFYVWFCFICRTSSTFAGRKIDHLRSAFKNSISLKL